MPATVIEPARDLDGVLVHRVTSRWQAGETELRILLPDERRAEEERFPVVFVLPVEAGREHHYGDGLAEVRRRKLHNKYRAIFAAPTFFHLPWYVDHPDDERIRQESYFVREIVPFVQEKYPVVPERAGRMLLGFSKSGWGAVSLLSRHPELFERAAAWDAPLMMDRLGKYGTTPIFGTEARLAEYAPTGAVRKFAAHDGGAKQLGGRLILSGYGTFRHEHQQFHALLEELKIAHVFLDGPERKHDWHSGWVAESVERLFAD